MFNPTYTPVYRNSNTTMVMNNNIISVVNATSVGNGGVGWNIPVIVGQNITISYGDIFDEASANNSNQVRYLFSDEPVTSMSSTAIGEAITRPGKSVTVTATKKYLFVLLRISNGNSYKLSNLMVSPSSDLTYIPHAEQNYPITLPSGMEIAKIPNTNYIDEIDIKNKKLIKKTQKIDSYNGETITTDYISTTGGLDIGATVYYGITSTEIPITDTTLINQLNAIHNAYTYANETLITQENADLPFILEVMWEVVENE